ncbi:MAG: septum formation protein Maf [Deltaproteobacteria bacterium]|nr:septum formation protein Maf [Deltaproteobacteria bacterium]
MARQDNDIIRPRLILASASPRRSFFLKELGLQFDILPTEIVEKVKKGETPVEFAGRLAVEKALAALKKQKRSGDKTVYSLGADTIVVLGGKIYGKPRHKTEATAFWHELGGQTHQVITAFAIAEFPDKIICVETATTAVTLKRPSKREVGEYLETGEPLDKAGAYAAQGIGKKFVEKIEGSVTNVIGLPLEALIPWLKKLKLL